MYGPGLLYVCPIVWRKACELVLEYNRILAYRWLRKGMPNPTYEVLQLHTQKLDTEAANLRTKKCVCEVI